MTSLWTSPFRIYRAAHCGAAKGQLETLRILSSHGANLWLRNVRGDFPLHDAVQSGRSDLVRWLLNFKQSSNQSSAADATNNDGRTPLHVAALHNNIEICKVNNKTTLFFAVMYSYKHSFFYIDSSRREMFIESDHADQSAPTADAIGRCSPPRKSRLCEIFATSRRCSGIPLNRKLRPLASYRKVSKDYFPSL